MTTTPPNAPKWRHAEVFYMEDLTGGKLTGIATISPKFALGKTLVEVVYHAALISAQAEIEALKAECERKKLTRKEQYECNTIAYTEQKDKIARLERENGELRLALEDQAKMSSEYLQNAKAVALRMEAERNIALDKITKLEAESVTLFIANTKCIGCDPDGYEVPAKLEKYRSENGND